MLDAGCTPIHGPVHYRIVAHNAAACRLSVPTDVDRAVAHGALQFIAVGTPPDEDGSADLQYVLAVARTIGRNIDKPTLVLGGEEDPMAPVSNSRLIASVIPGAELHICEGGGHLFPFDTPDFAAEHITNFLDRIHAPVPA